MSDLLISIFYFIFSLLMLQSRIHNGNRATRFWQFADLSVLRSREKMKLGGAVKCLLAAAHLPAGLVEPGH